MEYSELPEVLRIAWEQLPLNKQREWLSCLAQNTKPIEYRIKAKAEVNQVAPLLMYISKHKIPHRVHRRGAHVVFCFDSMEVRNKVLIGKNTI